MGLFGLILTSCDGGKEPTAPAAVASVLVTAPATSLLVGSTLQLLATLRDASGSELTGRPLIWTSSDTTRATVSASGLVRGVRAGPATISAASEGRTGHLALTVATPPTAVASVTVTAPSSSLLAGTTLQASAVARDTAGAVLPEVLLTWASSDTTTAKVSSTGLVSGLLAGPVTITASAEGRSGTLPLAVTAPVLTQIPGALTGHIGVWMNEASVRATHGVGFSYYTMISPLQALVTRDTQLGWGVWVSPENLTFTQPLCPVGTYARDNWPERGPTYRDVYQTLEGGAGLWTTTRFPSPLPKFRINSTPDCYNYQVASTGWQFWGSALPPNKLGLAQLSNRLLTVPDGVVFSGAGLLGYGWLALPLVPATTSALGVPTGDLSWTLFFRAQNFRGPVAFFTPEIWSAVNATDATGTGRGLDARPGFSASVALEIGGFPAFESQDRAGVRYRRVPRITFAAQGDRATLMQDVRYYSKSALWDRVASWSPGAAAPSQIDPTGVASVPMGALFSGLTMSGSAVAFQEGTFYSVTFPTAGGGQVMGMQWSGELEAGVIPEYYRLEGSAWRPVPASQTPRETFLMNQSFAPLQRGSYPDLNTSSGVPWDEARWEAGPFTVTLQDGSMVDYVWYRFVDQPAIARLGLDADARARLQAFAEALHASAATDGLTIPPPSSGTLVRIDDAQLVIPPPGLERGYVPIVIRHR